MPRCPSKDLPTADRFARPGADSRLHPAIEEFRGNDGTTTSVRRAGAGGQKVPVVMLHGLQSHSGWFEQSQVHLAASGHAVFAPDRRGSGLSHGARGDCQNYITLLSDIGDACSFARSQTRARHVHLVGHCFGALPALLYASLHGDEVISLTLASPALFTHIGVSFFQRLRIARALCTNGDTTFPMPYPDALLTDDAEWLAKIRRDPLALHHVTATFLYQIHRARQQLDAAAGRLRMPVFMASAGGDRICDNTRTWDLVARLRVPRRLHVEYPDARHILEFSADCQRFLQDLSAWTASTEPTATP